LPLKGNGQPGCKPNGKIGLFVKNNQKNSYSAKKNSLGKIFHIVSK
jgi:hypothetical protein